MLIKMRWIIIAVVLLLSACASISVNPETGQVQYYRIGDQQIEGLEVLKEGDKINVKMNKQNAKGEALNQLIDILKGLK